ncbi:MAG: hypothetical protein Kow001_19200 [Acidobacteriota bacterium]
MRMVVNDQSLVWGGLFDAVSGQWTTSTYGHSQHREGRHVDIPFRVYRNGSLSDPLPTSDPAWRALSEALAGQFGAGCQRHGSPTPDHWHCEK